MIFKGYGIIWNPAKNKELVNFNIIKEYKTEDKDEIAILENCNQIIDIIVEVGSDKVDIVKEDLILTKAEVKDILDSRGIEYTTRATLIQLNELMEKDNLNE